MLQCCAAVPLLDGGGCLLGCRVQAVVRTTRPLLKPSPHSSTSPSLCPACSYQDEKPFVSAKKVLGDLGAPFSNSVELASFHTGEGAAHMPHLSCTCCCCSLRVL